MATARADYEPFGEAVTIAGMPTGPLPAQQFTGQERDGLESQDYFGARYYRPRHGRFSQVDPVWGNLFDPQAMNRYRYARNNPLSVIDPTGRCDVHVDDPDFGFMCIVNVQGQVHQVGAGGSTGGTDLDADWVYRLLRGGSNAILTIEYWWQEQPPGDRVVLELAGILLVENTVNLALGGAGRVLVGRLAAVTRGAGAMAEVGDDVMAAVGRAGQAGEETALAAAGAVKNTTRIPSASGAAFRVPDIQTTVRRSSARSRTSTIRP